MPRLSAADTQTSYPNPTIKDRLSVHKTLLRLTATYKVIAVATCLIVALCWYGIVQRTLRFGANLDYSGLEALGLDGALIKQYNPFFWWTLLLICTLFVFYLLFHVVQYTRQRASQKTVTVNQLDDLLRTLSPAAIQVLNWCWDNKRFPITVGVLQQFQQQLALNRYSLICLAKDQESLLQQHLQSKTNLDEPLHHL